MAPGSRARRTPRRSPRRSPCGNPTADPAGVAQGPAEDPAEDPAESASTADSEGATAPSHASTPAPSRTLTPAPTPAPPPISAEELFKQFMKTYEASVKVLEQNGGQAGQAPTEPRERPLKAKVPDVYYGRSHMDCFHFCQQCEDHFETAGATGANRTPFAASFLQGNISVRWAQHKRRIRGKGVAPISWSEFKAFLRKNLGESKSFVDSIWREMKRDSQY